MPKHWWIVDPDNPGPRERADAIQEAARGAGGEVIFVGKNRKNTWFLLVDIPNRSDEDAVYAAVKGRGRLFKMFDPEEEIGNQSAY